VWRRDLRFGDLLPGVDATVHDIAISGHHSHQRDLLKTLPQLEKRLDEFGRESRDEALIRYVSANTGRSRQDRSLDDEAGEAVECALGDCRHRRHADTGV